MALFDDDGTMNEAHAQRVYNQASGQVTGQFPAGIPILGAGIDWNTITPATVEMAHELVEQVRPALEQGIDPNTPVMLGLYQAAQLARAIIELHAQTLEWHENTSAEPRDEFTQLIEQLGSRLDEACEE